MHNQLEYNKNYKIFLLLLVKMANTSKQQQSNLTIIMVFSNNFWSAYQLYNKDSIKSKLFNALRSNNAMIFSQCKRKWKKLAVLQQQVRLNCRNFKNNSYSKQKCKFLLLGQWMLLEASKQKYNYFSASSGLLNEFWQYQHFIY